MLYLATDIYIPEHYIIFLNDRERIMNSLIWIIFASVLLSPVTCKPLAENKLHKEAATKKV